MSGAASLCGVQRGIGEQIIEGSLIDTVQSAMGDKWKEKGGEFLTQETIQRSTEMLAEYPNFYCKY